MTAMDFRANAAFDAQLAVGQRVQITWTNCYRMYTQPATVTKVNAKSILAAIDNDIYDTITQRGALLYPAQHVIKVPRFVDLKHWSAGNCVAPLA